VPLLEARARFCEKTEKAIRLALSKFAKISVAYTLFGKMRLDSVPACVACDRPFGEQSGRQSLLVNTFDRKGSWHIKPCPLRALSDV
jgi:hypothetical protein